MLKITDQRTYHMICHISPKSHSFILLSFDSSWRFKYFSLPDSKGKLTLIGWLDLPVFSVPIARDGQLAIDFRERFCKPIFLRMNWSLSVSSTDWNYQIWFILTMTKSPQFHNRDPQFQFIRFQNEWLLSKMRFPRNPFLEFGLIRKPVSYQIRKIAFLLSGKWWPISYH